MGFHSKMKTFESFKYFLTFSLKYSKYFFKAFFLALISVALLLPLPVITKFLFDKIFQKDVSSVKQVSILIFVVIVSIPFISYLKDFSFQRFRLSIERDLKLGLMKNILSQELDFFTRYDSGYLVGRIGETSTLKGLMVDSLFYLLYYLITLIISAFAVLSLNFKIGLVIIGLLPLYSISLMYLSKEVKDSSSIVREYNSKFLNVAQDILSGAETIKTLPSIEQILNIYKSKLEQLFHNEIKLAKLDSATSNIPRLIMTIGIGYFFVKGAGDILKGFMSIGDFAAFNMFLNYLYQSSGGLAGIISSFSQSLATGQRVFELLQMRSANSKKEKPIKISKVRGEIWFNNVSFIYPDNERPALYRINLKIEPGEFIVLAGKTGAGKSTLLKLLMRFYNFQEGEILIDGFNIEKISDESYRKLIMLIPQDIYLFSTSIYMNLKLFKASANESELKKACQLSLADNFINLLPNGYQTEVGERGIKLSAGERQRLAIARAFLVVPHILLMDEATSHLDPETEKKILLNIKEYWKNKTVIMAAHRTIPLKFADRVILLDKGKIIDEGLHDELLRKSSAYYEIFREIKKSEIESKETYECF